MDDTVTFVCGGMRFTFDKDGFRMTNAQEHVLLSLVATGGGGGINIYNSDGKVVVDCLAATGGDGRVNVGNKLGQGINSLAPKP